MLPDTRQRARFAVTQIIGLSRSERLRALETNFPNDLQSQKEILALLEAYDAFAADAEPGGAEPAAPLRPTPLLTVGAVYGAYKVLQQIGAGGMGHVFLAEDVRLRRNVALKSLAGKWLDDPGARARVMREA